MKSAAGPGLDQDARGVLCRSWRSSLVLQDHNRPDASWAILGRVRAYREDGMPAARDLSGLLADRRAGPRPAASQLNIDVD